MKVKTTIISIVLMLMACEKATFPTRQAEQVLGEWDLVFLSNDTIDNVQDYEPKRLRFKKSGRYTLYLNNRRESRGKYSLTEEKDVSSGLPYLSMYLENESHLSVPLYFFGKDTFALLYPCTKCDYYQVYKRQQ